MLPREASRELLVGRRSARRGAIAALAVVAVSVGLVFISAAPAEARCGYVDAISPTIVNNQFGTKDYVYGAVKVQNCRRTTFQVGVQVRDRDGFINQVTHWKRYSAVGDGVYSGTAYSAGRFFNCSTARGWSVRSVYYNQESRYRENSQFIYPCGR